MNDSVSDQKRLEVKQKEEGRNRLLNVHNKALADGTADLSPKYTSIVRLTFSKAKAIIDQWKVEQSKVRAGNQFEAYKVLQVLPSAAIAQITVKTLVRCSLTNARLKRANLLMMLGRSLINEITIRKFIKECPEDYKAFQHKSKKHQAWKKLAFLKICRNRHGYKDNDGVQAAKVGATLYELVNSEIGIVKEVTVWSDKNRCSVHIELDERLEEAVLRNFNRLLDRAYTDLPMVTKPNEWTNDAKGGYLNLPYSLVSGSERSKETHSMLSESTLKALNAIQNTGWRVNESVLERVKLVIQNPNIASKLVEQEVEVPALLESSASKKEKQANGKLIGEAVRHNISARTKQLIVRKNIESAEYFKGKTLYYPVFLDFRTRVYVKASVLSPQGSDIQKGLLEFAEEKEVTTIDQVHWLLNHGANLWGIKGTFEEKIQKIRGMESVIADIVDGSHEWLNADEPVQFLAFCYEYMGLLETGLGFKTRLPVSVDGANNGSQILSILSRDLTLARATNVADSDRPQDVYQQVIDKAYEVIVQDSDKLSISEQQLLSEIDLDRKAAKKCTMCYPYSLTQHGGYGYINDWYKEATKHLTTKYTDKELSNVARYLRVRIWASVIEVQGGAAKTMKFLQGCARACMQAGLGEIYWTTPNRNKVWQKYRKVSIDVVQTHVCGRTIATSVATPEEATDKRRSESGISPNVVHSIDASCLQEAIRLALNDGVSNFAVVHDSFGTDCVSLSKLQKAVRMAYYELLKGDYLSEFRQEIRDQVGLEVELPKLPAKGDLNVEEILTSKYMFA